MNIIKLYNDLNYKKILSLVCIFLPVIFLFKHNVAGAILVLLSIISLILIIKKKIIIGFKENILILFFFIYVVLNSIYHENFIELRYIRFLLFYILLYFLIDEKFIKLFSQTLFFLIIFLCIDINFQKFSGYNLIGLKNLGYSSSFFGEEKIAGSFLLKIFFVYSFLIFFQIQFDFKKYFFLLSIVLVSILFTMQRISILNLFFFAFLFLLILKKYKILISIFIIILFSWNFFSEFTLVGKLKYIKKYIEGDFNNLTYTIKGYNIKKIKLDKEINFNKFLYNENIGEIYYFDNTSEPLIIKNFFKDKRVDGKTFKLITEGDDASFRVKEHFGLKKTDNISFDQYINYYNNFHKFELNSFLFSFGTHEKDHITFLDSGWGSHFYTAYLIWKDHLFFGSGIKSYRSLCINNEKYRNFPSLNGNFCVTHPHNFFLEILSELGLVGIILFYLLLFFISYRIIKSNLVLKNKLLILCLIILLFQPFQTSGRIFSNNESMFLFYYLAIIIKYINDKNPFCLSVKPRNWPRT